MTSSPFDRPAASAPPSRHRLSSATLLLAVLLLVDLAFVAFHLADAPPGPRAWPRFSIELDRGYPEIYQYLKWLVLMSLFGWFAVRHRSKGLGAWGLLFAYFLVDDSLSLHERVGARIAERLDLTPPFGLRLQDLGELAVSALAGLALLGVVYRAYRGGSPGFRRLSSDLFLLVVALAFFGVLVDLAHIAVKAGRGVNLFLGVLEDGGEMVVASLMVGYTVHRFARGGRPRDARELLDSRPS